MKQKHILMLVSGTMLVGGLAYNAYIKKQEPTNTKKREMSAVAYGLGGGALVVTLMVTLSPGYLEKAIKLPKG